MIPRIVKEMFNETKNKSDKKITKKDLIKSEFYNGTKLTLKGLAQKHKTSYQNVCNIHADYLQENEA